VCLHSLKSGVSLPFASPQRRLSYIYFAGPRAAEAHLGTAGCHVGFLNFPRRRGCLTDHRRILRSYFTMTSTIASILKQKPRNSSCVSMAVSIKNRQLLALTAQGSADRRGSTWPHTRRVMRLRAKTLESRCFRRKKRDEKEKAFAMKCHVFWARAVGTALGQCPRLRPVVLP